MHLRPGRTAVIVDIPEAVDAVGTWRQRYDTSAPLGVPPHVTILFPFVDLASFTADRADLAAIAAAEQAFPVSFAGFGIFPGSTHRPEVLYLEPTPAEPFVRLTAALWARWPSCPPYEGAHDDCIPHLTITETAPPEQVSAARRAVEPALPITAAVTALTLIAFDGTRWRAADRFPLRNR